MLSDDVLQHILDYLSTRSTKELSQNFKKVSKSYRTLDCKNTGLTKEDVDAYLIGRFPLTYEVIYSLALKLKDHLPSPLSVTDYGCGPITALVALKAALDDREIEYVGVEEKSAMKEAALYLASKLFYKAEIKQINVEKSEGFFSKLGIASYLLNELQNLDHFFDVLMTHHEYILVIEPGTPDGYKRLLKLREKALLNGFKIIAPCPHHLACPLKENDWCHFYTRCQRPKILKQIKEASLGYEDEKYCYLFLSKQTSSIHQGVILDKPDVYPYKVDLKVCFEDGSLKLVEIPKKDKDAFKNAKKLSWGDFI